MKKLGYFSKFELILWSSSVLLILISFFIFDRSGWLALIASLVGVTSLIFAAKGNPVGMALMIIFSVLYGAISYSATYYGEMVTYLGMTLPMSVYSLIAWLKHPYQGNRSEVTVNRISIKELLFACFLTAAVTFTFYFILKALGTANLIPSTFSVATSFLAVYLTARRSPYYPLVYAMNDTVLLILWFPVAKSEPSAISVIACFAAFLVNDCYGFISWRKMANQQTDDN